MDDEFGFAYTFASGLEQTSRTEGRLEYKNGLAAAGFCFDEFPRGIASDLLVGGAKKNQPMKERNVRLPQSFESEEGLSEPGLHIEDAGAVGFSARNTEGHFSQGAGGIDRVVVSEHEKLTRGPRSLRPPGDAKLVATVLLRDPLDGCAAFAPFHGEYVAAAIGGSFFQAGRLRENEPLDRGEHLWQAKFQKTQEFFGMVSIRHSRDMLTMTGSRSKRHRRQGRDELEFHRRLPPRKPQVALADLAVRG